MIIKNTAGVAFAVVCLTAILTFPEAHAQMDQTQFGVDEVEVIMQAFTGGRAQKSAVGVLAVPGLVSGTGFHRREDMHQAGMVAACGQHLGNHVLFADVAVGNVLDGNAGSRANSAARSRTRSRSGSANRG